MKDLQELNTVALLKDIPDHNLLRGDVGTIVTTLSETMVEAEFINKNGSAIAVLPLSATDLIKIRLDMVPV